MASRFPRPATSTPPAPPHARRIRERQTFDSSATPKAGEHVAPPKEIAPVDLERLKERMADTIERAKAEDPRELRKQIAELQKALKKPAVSLPLDTKAANREALEKAAARGALAMSNKMAREIRDVLRPLRNAMEQAVSKLRTAADTLEQYIPPDPLEFKSAVDLPAEPDPPAARPAPPRIERPVRPAPRKSGDPGAKLPAGERAVLTACAQYPDGATREQLSILTAYKRSSRDTYIQRLREKGFVEAGDLITATPEGVQALGSDFEPLPTGEALQDYWLSRLPEGERKILGVLIQAYPEAVDREAIDGHTNYKRSSRDTYIQRLRARQLVVVAGGGVRASAVLFER